MKQLWFVNHSISNSCTSWINLLAFLDLTQTKSWSSPWLALLPILLQWINGEALALEMFRQSGQIWRQWNIFVDQKFLYGRMNALFNFHIVWKVPCWAKWNLYNIFQYVVPEYANQKCCFSFVRKITLKDSALINVLWAVQCEKYFTFIAGYLLHLLPSIENIKEFQLLTFDQFCYHKTFLSWNWLLNFWLLSRLNGKLKTKEKVTPSPIFAEGHCSFLPSVVKGSS